MTQTIEKTVLKTAMRRALNAWCPTGEGGGKDNSCSAYGPNSPVFKSWFKNSKVTNPDGTPMVVYHGTTATFEDFSYEYMGQRGTSEGKGFYFTSSPEIASHYAAGEGGNVKPVYVSIQKPLELREKTIAKRDVSKFIKALDPDGTGYLSNWGDVETEGYNQVLRTAVQAEYAGADNDVDIVHSIINADGGPSQERYETLRTSIGYDGIIDHTPEWGGEHVIVVPLQPNQVKSTTGNKGTYDESSDIRNVQTSGKYSSTQVNLSPVLSQTILDWSTANIPEDILAEDGYETQPHITVKYGLFTDDSEDVRKLIEGFPPIQAIVGQVGVFEVEDNSIQRGGVKYDVIKLDIASDDLVILNKVISDSLPHHDSLPIYRPHITLAYVKPGQGRKYVGMEHPLSGHELVFDDVVYSSKQQKHTPIDLVGAETFNIFCPNGPGGGVDPTCTKEGPDTGGGSGGTPGAGARRLAAESPPTKSIRQPGQDKYGSNTTLQAISRMEYVNASREANEHSKLAAQRTKKIDSATAISVQMSKTSSAAFDHQQAAKIHKVVSGLTTDADKVAYHKLQVAKHEKAAKKLDEQFRELVKQDLEERMAQAKLEEEQIDKQQVNKPQTARPALSDTDIHAGRRAMTEARRAVREANRWQDAKNLEFKQIHLSKAIKKLESAVADLRTAGDNTNATKLEVKLKAYRAALPRTENVYCPTGPGGGVDPTCGKGGWNGLSDVLVKDPYVNAESEVKVYGNPTGRQAMAWFKKYNGLRGITSKSRTGAITLIWDPNAAVHSQMFKATGLKSANFYRWELDFTTFKPKEVEAIVTRIVRGKWTPEERKEFRNTILRNVFCPNGKGGGKDPTCRKEDLTKYARSTIPKFDPAGTYPLYHVTSDVNLKHILKNGIGSLDMKTYNPSTGEAQLQKNGYVSWTRDPAYKINNGNVTLVVKNKQKLVEKGQVPEHAVAMLAVDMQGDELVPGIHEQEEITHGIVPSDLIDEIHIPQSLHDEWTKLIPRYEGFIQKYENKIKSFDPTESKYEQRVAREQLGIIAYQKDITQLKMFLSDPRLRVGEYVKRDWDSGDVSVVNAFCPTGKGNGQDNSCSPNNKGAGVWNPETDSFGSVKDDFENAESSEHIEAMLDHYKFVPIENELAPKGLYQNEEGDLVEWNGEDNYPSYTPVSELNQWVYDQDTSDLETHIEDQFQKDFWSPGNGPVYHATSSDNIESIQKNGIEVASETRGMSNRNVGDAVYTTADIKEALAGSYGDAVFEVDTQAMRQDGITPTVSMEPDIIAGEARSTLAHIVGNDDFNYDYEDGMSANTVVVHGSIPAKYLKLVE